MCNESHGLTVELEQFASVVKGVMAMNNANVKDSIIVETAKRLVKKDNANKNKLFEHFCRVPSYTRQESTEVTVPLPTEYCSALQLLCYTKHKELFEWIMDQYADLLSSDNSPFDVHPLDMITEPDSLYGNNLFHFACARMDSINTIEMLIEKDNTTEQEQEATAPNPVARGEQTTVKVILSRLMTFERIKQKDLLNQFNKNGDTPVHVSCMSDMHLVWGDMFSYGATLDLPNKQGKKPVDLLTNDQARKAFARGTKGNKNESNKSEPKKTTPKRATRSRTVAKRTRGPYTDSDDEEADETADVEQPPRTRRRTQK
jgi:hypothetical protein